MGTNSFGPSLRRVLLAGTHTPRVGKKPSKKLSKFFRILTSHNLHLKFCDKSAEFEDFTEKVQLKTRDIGKKVSEVEFDNGILIIGRLNDTTSLFRNKIVVFSAYFNAEKQCYTASFIAVKKDDKVTIKFGKMDGEYFTNLYGASKWQQLNFATGEIYNCRKGKTIRRRVSKKKLPKINLNNTLLAEEQQMHKTEQAWNPPERTMVFYRGKLILC